MLFCLPKARLRLHIDCEAITDSGPHGQATRMVIAPQEPLAVIQGAPEVPITLTQPQAVFPTVSSGESGGFPSAEHVLNVFALKCLQPVDPSKPEELNDYIQRIEKVKKVLTPPKLEMEYKACPEYNLKPAG